MKNNIKIFIVLAAMLFVGCDSLVDVEPKGFMIPQKASDLRMMLNNVSGRYTKPRPVTIGYSLIQYAGDQTYYSDSEPIDGKYESVYAYYMRDTKLIQEHNHGDILYMSQLVALSNTVLDILPTTSDLSVAERNQIKGEALVHRSYAFLTLVNIHAAHYDKNTASADLGIPMLLNHDVTADIPARSTVQEVYKQITDDLTEAIDLLGGITENRALPSKAAANALLARTNLYMSNFNDALTNSENVLELQANLYNLEDYLTADDVLDLPGRDYKCEETILHKEVDNSMAAGSAKRYVSAEFWALYKEGDLRAKYYSETDGQYSYTNYPYTFSGILISEMLLIRAECNARKGKLALALTDLNYIRSHRFKAENYTDLSSENQDEVMDWVLNERRIELAWIGLRWFDMKRLNKEVKYQKTLTRTYKGKTIVFEPNSELWVFPFPGSILEEGLIEQNP